MHSPQLAGSPLANRRAADCGARDMSSCRRRLGQFQSAPQAAPRQPLRVNAFADLSLWLVDVMEPFVRAVDTVSSLPPDTLVGLAASSAALTTGAVSTAGSARAEREERLLIRSIRLRDARQRGRFAGLRIAAGLQKTRSPAPPAPPSGGGGGGRGDDGRGDDEPEEDEHRPLDLRVLAIVVAAAATLGLFRAGLRFDALAMASFSIAVGVGIQAAGAFALAAVLSTAAVVVQQQGTSRTLLGLAVARKLSPLLSKVDIPRVPHSRTTAQLAAELGGGARGIAAKAARRLAKVPV